MPKSGDKTKQGNAIPAWGGGAFPQPIAAGATVVIQATGLHAYFIICSAPNGVMMRLRGADWVGEFVPAYQGTGYDAPLSDDPFTSVDIKNTSSLPITVVLWAGWANFRDQRLILANSSIPNIINPLYSGMTPAASVQVPDLSGTIFSDVNGTKWIAIARIGILLSNNDPSNEWMVQKFASVGFNDGSTVFIIQPETEIQLPVSGNYSVFPAAGNVTGTISEIYQAVLVT
jgi:hypothetical protein